MDIRNWETGDRDNVPIVVHSRPSVLYRQLFGSSLGGIVTSYIRYGLVVLCILFALIEALALWAARRLSLAITTSVEELYAATQRVDRGDFVHRIHAAPAAKSDQLGELARSFNRMTGSLERLLLEQQEKERMQSELSIAQEVQANLFPAAASRSAHAPVARHLPPGAHRLRRLLRLPHLPPPRQPRRIAAAPSPASASRSATSAARESPPPC